MKYSVLALTAAILFAQSKPPIDSPTEMLFGKNAEVNYANAVKKDPNNYKLRAKLAEVYFLNKKYDEAKVQYDHIVKKDKKNFLALKNLGKIAVVQDQPAKALTYFGKASKFKGDRIDPYYDIEVGKAHYLLDDKLQAMKIFNQALATKDADKIKMALANFYFEQNDLNVALKYYQDLNNKYKKSPIPYLRLGQIYKVKGNKLLAKEKINRFLEITKSRTGQVWINHRGLAEALLKTL